MKKLLNNLSPAIIGLAILFSACKKQVVQPAPGNGEGTGTDQSTFNFSVTELPGINPPANEIYAIVSIINAQDQLVVTNKKLALSLNGKYITAGLELPNGEYKLTRFTIVNEHGVTRFATPIHPSEKATLVLVPLPLSFSLSTSTANIAVQVLSVANTDKPGSFGYPAGSFNTAGDTKDLLTIKVQTVISIGKVIYDSIPAPFTLTTWDENNNETTVFSTLAAGVNEVQVPKSAIKYGFKVSKWGMTDEMTLLKADVQEGTIYTLGGGRAEKKLRSEVTYKFIAGVYQPDTRRAYEYDESGKLKQVLYYLRKQDNTPYLGITDKFIYNNAGKTGKIIRFNEHNVQFAETSFAYDQQGKIVNMVQKDVNVHTSAQVVYNSLQGGGTSNGNYTAKINYHYSPSNNSMTYHLVFRGGCLVRDVAGSSNHGGETGNYQYDFNINPYVHMDWPDIYLSHHSKHNIVSQQKEYAGSIPVAVPYGYEYSYGNDGYPSEQIKNFKSYSTGQFLYKIKTVYNY